MSDFHRKLVDFTAILSLVTIALGSLQGGIYLLLLTIFMILDTRLR